MKTSVLVLLLLTGCKSATNLETISDSKGYATSELRSDRSAWEKANQAVKLLENNGWCAIPQQSLPRGYSNSDLVRHMACVANGESVFGQTRTGPGDTGFGVPYGYWQIVTGHMGRSFNGYRCPARSVAELRDNFDISAQCALFVFMERGGGNAGFRAWEAECPNRKWDMTRSDGQPVFPVACGSNACSKNIGTAQKGKEFVVSMANTCDAKFVEGIPLSVKGSTIQATGKSIVANIVQSGSQKIATFDLSSLDPKFNKLRIQIKRDSQTLWTSNPSPAIDLDGPGVFSQETFGVPIPNNSVQAPGTAFPTEPITFPEALGQPQIVPAP
jgi:hypothetical protein